MYVKPNSLDYGKEFMLERDPETGKRFRNVLKMRSKKNQAWMSIADKTDNVLFFRYEDIAYNPTGFVEKFSKLLSISHKEKIDTISSYKGDSKIKNRIKRTIKLAISGKLRKKRNIITKNDKEFICSQLNIELEKNVGT